MQKLQSALSVVLKLVMQWSHSIILTILSIVSLQYQGVRLMTQARIGKLQEIMAGDLTWVSFVFCFCFLFCCLLLSCV